MLGTKGTVKREYTKKLIRDFAQGCEVTLVGSPELASLAEAALSGGTVRDGDIAAELAPCFVGEHEDAAARTDTVVLACTHYPLLIDRLVRLRRGRSTGSIRRRQSRAASSTCSARQGTVMDDSRRRDDLHLEAAACAEPAR